MKRTVLTALAALLVLVAAPAAHARETQCVGALTGTFQNVVVPPGATCFLTNSTVTGNVKALENSTLNFGGNTIRGNLIGDKAERIDSQDDSGGNRIGGNVDVKDGDVDNIGRDFDLYQDTVEGNVTVENMAGDISVEASTVRRGNLQVSKSITGPSVGLEIIGSEVLNGQIQLIENQIGFSMNLSSNRVSSNVQVFKNSGAGNKRVIGNTIGGNLQCKENTLPFVGQPNVVAGRAEDQCAVPTSSGS